MGPGDRENGKTRTSFVRPRDARTMFVARAANFVRAADSVVNFVHWSVQRVNDVRDFTLAGSAKSIPARSRAGGEVEQVLGGDLVPRRAKIAGDGSAAILFGHVAQLGGP